MLAAADVLEILLLIRSIHAQEEGIVRHFVDQDVVDETAMLIEQPGILRLPVLQLGDAVGGDVVGQLHGFRPANFDLAHVADIEQADRVAHGVVFVDQAGILHRHIPAAEIDHLRAGRAVHFVQRRALQSVVSITSPATIDLTCSVVTLSLPAPSVERVPVTVTFLPAYCPGVF